MRVKDYKCKCGHDDFFFADKGNQKGIYCSYCGKWLKWADKDEQNLTLKQEPQGMTEIDFIQPKRTVGKLISIDVLDKIRAEIEAYQSDAFYPDDVMMRMVLDIIDKHIAESED